MRQVIHLLHAGLAAVEPEVHNRKGIARKQAVVHAVALKVLALKLWEGMPCAAALAAGIIAGEGLRSALRLPGSFRHPR